MGEKDSMCYCGVIQMPKLTILSVHLSGFNEPVSLKPASQLSLFPFISEMALQGNVYLLIKCSVGRDFESLINTGI